jgi:DUF177 domain-containing protein
MPRRRAPRGPVNAAAIRLFRPPCRGLPPEGDEPRMNASPFRLSIADLLHHPASRREVRVEVAELEHAQVGTTRLDPAVPLVTEAVLERIPDGIVVRGRAHGRWTAPCARCLTEVGGALDSPISELFEAEPLEGETYGLDGDEIDLEIAVRDAVLLELPVAPRCDDECSGLCPVCGIDRNDTVCDCDPNPPDPRWDALRELQI